jgi:heterodisulfide reductase subunit B
VELQAQSDARSEPLSKAVLDTIGQNIFRCYQCVKCTAGCPLADEFDLTPNQVMRQDIDVVGVMDELRIEARKRNIPAAVPDVQQFNRLFMLFVKWFGRLPELIFILTYKLLRGKPFADMGMGLRMMRKGKLTLLPHFARTPKKVEPMENPAGKVAYFPGCAASSTSKEYDQTVRSTAEALGIQLVEPPGWVCCGSSCAHATDRTEAKVLPMRTMATIERMGMTKVTSPCSNCFFRLKTAEIEGAHRYLEQGQTPPGWIDGRLLLRLPDYTPCKNNRRGQSGIPDEDGYAVTVFRRRFRGLVFQNRLLWRLLECDAD